MVLDLDIIKNALEYLDSRGLLYRNLIDKTLSTLGIVRKSRLPLKRKKTVVLCCKDTGTVYLGCKNLK